MSELLARSGLTLTAEPPVETKKLNGWQVFLGEKIDELRDGGMSFGEASTHLMQEWRDMSTEAREAYNKTGKEGVVVDVTCGRCHKKFPCTGRKNEHQKSCGGERCGICNKMFSSSKAMKEHYNAKHTTNFRCAECLKCFGGLSKLNRHKSVHDKTKAVTCNVCGKMFSRVDNLNKHKKSHV